MSPEGASGDMRRFHARVVSLIADGKPENAMRVLSAHYGIPEPDLRIGTVKRYRKVVACYVEKEKCIYLSRSDYLDNPYVILHEFYHHLRASEPDKRRQVEKRADLFASAFLRDFILQQQSLARNR